MVRLPLSSSISTRSPTCSSVSEWSEQVGEQVGERVGERVGEQVGECASE